MPGQGAQFGDLPEAFADFPRIWRDECAPALRALEAERKAALRRAAVVGVLGGAIAAALFVWGASSGAIVPMFLAVAVLVAAGATAAGVIMRVTAKAKRALLHPALAALGMRHEEKGFDPPAFGPLRGFSLLPYHDKASFEDLIAGDGFALCEAHLTKEVKTKDSTTTVTTFRGLIGYVEHPAQVLGQTVLARDAGIFNAMSAPRGMKRAGLVDSRFEKIFEVWTTDQVEARYLVTPVVMERLLALEERFHGKALRAAFDDGRLCFALDSKNLFEVGSAFSSFEDPARMRRLIAELASVHGLVTALRALPAGR